MKRLRGQSPAAALSPESISASAGSLDLGVHGAGHGRIGLALHERLGATAALAATAVYKITKIDAATRTITLGNNQNYVVDANVKLEDFKVGDQVRVIFTSENGKNTATAITLG